MAWGLQRGHSDSLCGPGTEGDGVKGLGMNCGVQLVTGDGRIRERKRERKVNFRRSVRAGMGKPWRTQGARGPGGSG